jgi:GxxExxY protein
MNQERDPLTHRVIGCAIEVHRNLGPGLLESAYEICLAYELERAGLLVERQLELPVVYKDIKLNCGYRVDLIVEKQLLIELKSVSELLPVHEAQLLTYMKLTGISKGLLLNFNVPTLKDGIKRMVL